MGKWEKVRLDSCFSIIRNGASIKQGVIEGGLPITRIETIANGYVDREKMGYAGISDIDKYDSYMLVNDDILMSHINSEKHLGKTALYKQKNNEKIIHGMNLLCLRPLNRIVWPSYIFYYFQSKLFKQQIPKITKKSVNQASFNITALKDLMAPLPPMEIQQKIAATLDTAAALLKLRQQQLVELEALIQSVFYQMFGDPVRNEKGWEKELLKKMCTKLTDGTHFSPPNNVVGDYKYVTAKNIKQHGLDLSNISYISEADHKSIYSRCNPEKGDVLYIKDGATTGIAVVNTLSEEFSLLSSVALLKHDRRRIEGSFLKVILNNKNMKSKIREDMGGAAITRLTLTKISNIQIPVPPLPLQTQFAAIVQKIDQQKALVQQSIDETQTLFDSLMSQYFD